MASIVKRLKEFARSPQGERMMQQAKEEARKPENRRRFDELRRRFGKGG